MQPSLLEKRRNCFALGRCQRNSLPEEATMSPAWEFSRVC